MTSYAEDNHVTSTLKERLYGSAKSPSDHYMRPFWQAVVPQEHCLGNV